VNFKSHLICPFENKGIGHSDNPPELKFVEIKYGLKKKKIRVKKKLARGSVNSE
jgi:hypothetical protein